MRRFLDESRGYPKSMARRPETSANDATARRRRTRKAVLLFFYSPSSGPSRRMDGIVSWLYVRERKRLSLQTVNVDSHHEIASRFGVESVPALILLKDGQQVTRLDGRVTGQQIDDAVLPHLDR
jgi:thioredoxin